MEATIDKYQKGVNLVFEKYMLLYSAEHPNEKTPLTAKQFLFKYNDNYRKEINNIAILAIQDSRLGEDVNDKILELNDFSTIKLHDKIIDISNGN